MRLEPTGLPTGHRCSFNGREHPWSSSAAASGSALTWPGDGAVSPARASLVIDFLILHANTTWASMLTPGVSVFEKMLRPIIVYLALVIGLRVFGKRELAQLNPFDLVVLLTLSNTVQNAIIGEDISVTGGLIGALTLLTINYLVIRFLFKHRRLDQLVEGRATVLIDDGHVIPEALARELLTLSELRMVAHRQGFAHLSEIKRCVLEPGGIFAIQGKVPSVSELHHNEMIREIEGLRAQIEDLKRILLQSGSAGTTEPT